MKVSIIILAQHEELFKQCLSRIRLYTDQFYELVVINDGASEEISKWCRLTKDIKLLVTETRVGVAKGFNMGAAAASGDRLVFIRDHMYVAEGWLGRLLACLDEHPDAAMAGGISNDVSGEQRLPFPCNTVAQLDNIAKAFALTKKGRFKHVKRLLSSLVMVRREPFEQLGRFDERFELESYEDDDLCYRMLRAGYGLYVVEDCFIWYITPPLLFPDNPDWYEEQLILNREKANAKWGGDLTRLLSNWSGTPTVSLCMVVKDDEKLIDWTLSSICETVDEIVIVDTGSRDNTKEIARRYTNRIYDFERIDDFSAARAYSFSLATMQYILWLDSGDIVSSHEADKLKTLMNHLPKEADVLSINCGSVGGANMDEVPSVRSNRIIRRRSAYRWEGTENGCVDVQGTIIYSNITIIRRS